MKNRQEQFMRMILHFLKNHRLFECQCSTCGVRFFSFTSRSTCSSPSCETRLKFPEMDTSGSDSCKMSITSFGQKIEQYFIDRGYYSARRSNVVNDVGDTLFISAGLQIYDPLFHEDKPVSRTPHVVAQASIRLNYIEQAGREEGFSSSFVNFCTEQAYAKVPYFIEHLDSWLDWFHLVNLDNQYLTILIESDPWIVGSFYGFRLVFNYGGLELGDGIYIIQVPGSQKNINIVDFSFGLERLHWISRSSGSYFDPLIPAFYRTPGKLNVAEIFRTIVLITMCAVTPTSKGPGRKLRKLIKRISPHFTEHDVTALLNQYYADWQPFIEPVRSSLTCYKIIQKELLWSINLDIARRTHCPVKP